MAYPHKSQMIADTIARWFEEKRFAPGSRFPSDQELARQFGVNHITVRTALRRFVEAGLLERRVGAGTVVRDPARARGEMTPAPIAGVGLALPDATHSFFSELLRGVEEALTGSRRPLVFGHTWEMPAREEQVVDTWMDQGLRLMILTPPVLEARFYNRLLGRGARLVFVDRKVPGVPVPSIVSRDEIGMKALVDHVVEARARRRLVHLAGPATIWTAWQRRETFVQRTRELGLSPELAQVRDAGYFLEDGYRATRALLERRPLPQAIVAANDPVAVGAIRALEEAGVRVPDDVVVTGYGNTDLGRTFDLPTVNQFPARMGTEAVKLILGGHAIGAEDGVELIPELVLRAPGQRDEQPVPPPVRALAG